MSNKTSITTPRHAWHEVAVMARKAKEQGIPHLTYQVMRDTNKVSDIKNYYTDKFAGLTSVAPKIYISNMDGTVNKRRLYHIEFANAADLAMAKLAL